MRAYTLSTPVVALALLTLCSACKSHGSNRDSPDELDGEVASGKSASAAADDTGPPELPRTLLDTREVPATGRRINVPRGGDVQRALDDARAGDVILLEAGAQFVGSFKLPVKDGAGWITIRSSAADAELPPAGVRMDPSYAAKLPKLVTPNDDPALVAAAGAHHFRIVAVEITAAPNVTRNSALVLFGGGRRDQRRREDVPHHLIIDRSYVHGHATLATKRCVALNSAFSAVIDSYLADCHDKGFDAQAICGWNGPGPFKIVNNYLEGSGENVMFGGGDPGIRGLVPSDIEVRHNHFFKPLAWKGVWTVKNIFELKNAQRVLVEGNVFENNWVDAQDGFALMFKSENQDGTAPWTVTRNVTVRYNKIFNSPSGVNIGASYNNAAEGANRILIEQNLFDRIGPPELGGGGRLWELVDDPSDLTFDHNTAFAASSALMLTALQKTFVTIRNNVLARGEYGFFGSGQGEGNRAIDYYLRASVITHNVIIGAKADMYPAGNFFPERIADVGFIAPNEGDYRLARGSRYKRGGTDGRDVGADIDSLNAAIAGVAHR